MTNEYVDNNPKTAIGAKKVPLHLIPPAAKHHFAMAMENGANKYGPYNWRDKRVSVMTYLAAAMRHMDAYLDGEDKASDSGVHHLAHAMACFGIVLDAQSINMLIDDRPTKGASARLQEEYFTNKEVVKNAPIAGKDFIQLDGMVYWNPKYPVEQRRLLDVQADVRPEAGR
jgi:hypothetical protein